MKNPETCNKRGKYLARSKDAVYYRCDEVGYCENQVSLGFTLGCRSGLPEAGLL